MPQEKVSRESATDTRFDQTVDDAARQWLLHQDALVGGHPAPENLLAFQEGHLEEAESAKIREHLKDCEDCRDELEALESFDQPVSGTDIDSAHRESWQAFVARRAATYTTPQASTGSRRISPFLLQAASIVFALVGVAALFFAQRGADHGGNLMVVDLIPNGASIQRSSEPFVELRVPEAVGSIAFRLQVAGLPAHEAFEIDVTDVEGRLVFSTDRVVRDPQGRFALELTRDQLPNGKYSAGLWGIDGEQRVRVAEYSFRLTDDG